MGNIFEIVVVLLLIILNGVFSMSETAMVSARKARLQQRANGGDKRAQAALDLAAHPNRFLSTVQIGITLIGILAGAFGGASLSEQLALGLQKAGVPVGYSKSLAFGLVVALITYLSLVIGELVPKRLALNDPEGIATRMARPMRTLSTLTAPVVALLGASTNGLLRLLGAKPSDEPPITEEEITLLIAQGTQAGVFEEQEQDIVERVFRLGDRRVSSLMTPRGEVIWLDVEDPWELNRQKIAEAHHSSFPICRGGWEEVLGVVPLKDIWAQTGAGQTVDLAAAARRPLYVLESTRALDLPDQFKATGQHLALVVDEYGTVIGLVTLHDVLEAMVGDVPAAEAPQDVRAVRREDGSWLLDGMLPIEEVQRLLEITTAPEDADDYTSLGGFVMARLGRIPNAGDKFDWSGFCFEVMDMDGHRVDRVLVAPAKNPTAAS